MKHYILKMEGSRKGSAVITATSRREAIVTAEALARKQWSLTTSIAIIAVVTAELPVKVGDAPRFQVF